MKSFLIKLGFFLLPILLVWISIEFFYQTVTTNYSYKHQKIQQHYSHIQTMVLGDSHSFFGINPAYLDGEAFSLANISQSLYFDHLLFEKHADSLLQLKNVILTIGYYSLSQLDNAKEDQWRKYFYGQQMDLEMDIIAPWDITKYSLSVHRSLGNSLKLMKKYVQERTIVSCDTLGWGVSFKHTVTKDWEKASIKTVKRHEDGLQDFTHNLVRLQKVIDKCKQINCKVFLIDMPVHQEYVKATNHHKLHKSTVACEKLAEQNYNVTYFNLREHPELEDEDLYDPDHLNHQGAKKFTAIINKMIQDSY